MVGVWKNTRLEETGNLEAVYTSITFMKIGDKEYNCWVDYESELHVKFMPWGVMETFLRWVRGIVEKDGTVYCQYGSLELMNFICHAIVDYDLSWIRHRLMERFVRKERWVEVDEESLAEVIGVIAKKRLEEELSREDIVTNRERYDEVAKINAYYHLKTKSFESMQMRMRDLQTKESQFREYLKTDDAKDDHPARCTYVPPRIPRPCAIKI